MVCSSASSVDHKLAKATEENCYLSRVDTETIKIISIGKVMVFILQSQLNN